MKMQKIHLTESEAALLKHAIENTAVRKRLSAPAYDPLESARFLSLVGLTERLFRQLDDLFFDGFPDAAPDSEATSEFELYRFDAGAVIQLVYAVVLDKQQIIADRIDTMRRRLRGQLDSDAEFDKYAREIEAEYAVMFSAKTALVDKLTNVE